MQVKKPIILHLPGEFVAELERCIKQQPPLWSYKMDYFYYLINYLIMREMQMKNVETKFFSINIKRLRSVTVSNIDRYIKYLVDVELLKRDNYIIGEKSYHYQLNPEYLEGIRRVQLEPGSRVFEKLTKSWKGERHNANRLQPHLKQMRNLFLKLDIDYDGAIDWIESNSSPEKKY